jgi:hypothetical protein
LRQAMAQDQLWVAFQPHRDCRTGTSSAPEACCVDAPGAWPDPAERVHPGGRRRHG